MRIDRFLSDMGYGTRSEIKKMIRSGRVYFCDKVCKDPGMKVAETDVLRVVPDGNLKKRGGAKVSAEDGGTDMNMENPKGFVVKYEPYQYILLNKPVGVVSAVTDPIHQTVVDICKGYGVRDESQADSIIVFRQFAQNSQCGIATGSTHHLNDGQQFLRFKQQAHSLGVQVDIPIQRQQDSIQSYFARFRVKLVIATDALASNLCRERLVLIKSKSGIGTIDAH